MKKSFGVLIYVLLTVTFVGYVALSAYYILAGRGWSGWYIFVSIFGAAIIWRSNEAIDIVKDLGDMLPDSVSGPAKFGGLIVLVGFVLITFFAILTLIGYYAGPCIEAC